MPRYSRFGSKETTRAQHREVAEPYKMDDISLGYLQLGETEISTRTATIDCAFRNRESTWGTASGECAGVLILHVTLAQPAEYKLKSATMNLYLRSANTLDHGPIATDVAPRRVCGLTSETEVTTGWQIQPELMVGNIFTVGGIGYTNTKKYLKEHRWMFETARLPEEPQRDYTKVQLIWESNPDNNQTDRCGPLKVALGIRHCDRPFLIELEIAGKLKKKLRRYKYRGKAPTKLSPVSSGKDIEEQMTLAQMEADTKKFNSSE